MTIHPQQQNSAQDNYYADDEIELIDNIKVIQEPEVSLHPIKPKKKLNVVLAGVVGFILAVFIAFFAEYIKNSKQKSTTQHQQ